MLAESYILPIVSQATLSTQARGFVLTQIIQLSWLLWFPYYIRVFNLWRIYPNSYLTWFLSTIFNPLAMMFYILNQHLVLSLLQTLNSLINVSGIALLVLFFNNMNHEAYFKSLFAICTHLLVSCPFGSLKIRRQVWEIITLTIISKLW